MKQTPEEKAVLENLQPGKITKDGLIGNDERNLSEIIETDLREVAKIGLDLEQAVEKLQEFIEIGKSGLESPVDIGDYVVDVQWRRGMIPCPYKDPPLIYKISVVVFKKKTQEELKYTQLSLHLIKKHQFFGGKGSLYRLEPKRLKEFLEL